MTDESERISVHSYFPAPSGAVLRVVAVERDGGEGDIERVERVELVDPDHGAVMRRGRVKEGDATVVRIYEDRGMKVSQFYNMLLEPLVLAELEAARERKNEAEQQGDTIEYHNAEEYIEELEETLHELR